MESSHPGTILINITTKIIVIWCLDVEVNRVWPKNIQVGFLAFWLALRLKFSWLWFVSQSALKTKEAGSFDSLSDAIDASKPLKSMIEVKQLGKNFMKSNWKKYWAVLQNNSLYIYYDKTETAMVQVRIQSSPDGRRDPRTRASDSGTRWFRVVQIASDQVRTRTKRCVEPRTEWSDV